MKKCNKCNITIETNQEYCPLCHQTLEGKTKPGFKEVYPEYISINSKVVSTLRKSLMTISIVSVIVLILVNYFTFEGRYWAAIPLGGILYFWLLVRVGVLSKRNVAFRISFLTVLAIGLLILIDYQEPLTTSDGYRWSINFLMPLMLLSCNLAISTLMWIKRLYYRDYFFYLLIIVLFSLIPLILAMFDIVVVLWPSLIAFGLAVFIVVFLFVFFPKSIKEEIRKRFHA